MKKKNAKQFMQSLMLIGMLCCTSCAREHSETLKTCPTMPKFPIAGPKVATELEQLPNAPHTWEWLARLYQLKQVLEVKE